MIDLVHILLPSLPRLLPANGLGLLVLVVPVLGLHLLDLGDVLLLRLLDRDAVVDRRLPGVVLGLALRRVLVGRSRSGVSRREDGEGDTCLEVEHAGLGGLLNVLAGSDLKQGCVRARFG